MRRRIAEQYNVELCLRDRDGRIVAWLVGYSEEEIADLLLRHSDWYRSTEEFREE